MSECPVCHENKRRLDLHIKAKHPDYKQKPSRAEEPSKQVTKRLLRRVVKNSHDPPVTDPPVKERELAPMLTSQIEPIRLCDVQDPIDFQLNTPLTLQAAIESPQYERHIRSLKFGKAQAMSRHWLIILIIAMVGIVMLLYFTGVIPTGR